MTARRGAGTVVEIGSTSDPGTAVFTAIPSIRSFRISRRSGEQEVTALDSTAKEYIRDLADGGTGTMEVNYDPALASQNEITGLMALFETGETRAFRVTPNGATKREIFSAFVMTEDKNFDPSQAMTMSVEMRITGARTFEAV